MDTLAQYQSVLQLAAGTNIAITGLIGVYSAELSREGRRATDLASHAKKFNEKLADFRNTTREEVNNFKELTESASNLKAKANTEEKNAGSAVVFATMICLFAAILSLVLLVISSFKPEVEFSNSMWLATALTLPAFICVTMAALRYVFVERKLRLDRQSLQNQLLWSAGLWLAADRVGGPDGEKK